MTEQPLRTNEEKQHELAFFLMGLKEAAALVHAWIRDDGAPLPLVEIRGTSQLAIQREWLEKHRGEDKVTACAFAEGKIAGFQLALAYLDELNT